MNEAWLGALKELAGIQPADVGETEEEALEWWFEESGLSNETDYDKFREEFELRLKPELRRKYD